MVDKDRGPSERDAGPLRHETSQVVYPLGFDDPSGLQSQQSVSLLPALSVPTQGITSETLHAALDDIEAGRADPEPEEFSDVHRDEASASHASPWRQTGHPDVYSSSDGLSPIRFRPSMGAVQRARQYLGGRRKFGTRRSSASMDGASSFGGASSIGDDSVRREGSATSGSVFDLGRQPDRRPTWKLQAATWLESLRVTAFVTFATFLALFMDDTRLAILPTSLDNACQYISLAIMVVFAVETILSSLVRQGYFLQLYFWIDLVAALSMALDVPAITNRLTHNPDGSGSGAGRPTLSRGKASGLIQRLRSIMRVTRILRLMRLVQLYSRYQAAKENAEFARSSGLKPTMKNWWLPSKTSERSRVGQKLSDMTTQKVIVGILAMLLIVPAFNIYSGLYGDYAGLTQGGLQIVHDLYLDQGDTHALTDANANYALAAIYKLVFMPTSNVVNLVVANNTFVDSPSGVALRSVELALVSVDQPACDAGVYAQCFVSIAVFNIRWNSQFNAVLNIVRTLFVTFALGFAMITFNKDAQRLVLRPIERMLRKVKDVSENPLAGRGNSKIKVKVDGDPLMETRILETALLKICSLLAVGFGDAGAEVIADNIKSGGDLNPMIPGHKIIAIFGFCDIRQFTDATEVLQEDVMEFVNSIAKIVHMEVSLHGGSPNKNIGDAFLLVWKLPRGFTSRDIPRPSRTSGWGPPPPPSPGYAPPQEPLGTGPAAAAGPPVSSPVAVLAFAEPTKPGRSPLGAAPPLRSSSGGIVQATAVDVRLLEEGPPEATNSALDTAEQQKLPARRKSILKQPSVIPASRGPVSSNQVAPLPPAAPHVLFGRGSDKQDSGGQAPTAERLARLDELTGVGKKLRRRTGQSQGSGSEAGGEPLDPAARLQVVQNLADKALASFVIIQAALKRSQRLSVFAHREDLNKRMPNFQVRMGFGLHVGWAIEGAIGSEYKIDASYLSPNVNMASRLEAATKQFGTTILLSEDVVCMLSSFVRQRVRQIDCVTLKGSQRPMGLFTYDVTLEQVNMPDVDSMPPTPVRSSWAETDINDSRRPSIAGQRQLQQEVQTFSMSAYENEFLEHPDLADTWAVDTAFLARFAEGFAAYRSGDWAAAQGILEETRKARRTADGRKVLDGPSCTLLDYMRTHNFSAPASWKGHRELTEK